MVDVRRAVVASFVVIVLPSWSVSVIVRCGRHLVWDSALLDMNITPVEGTVLAHVAVLVAVCLLVVASISSRSVRSRPTRRFSEQMGPLRRPIAWLAAAVAVSPVTVPSAPRVRQEAQLPVGTVLSPAVASAVIAHILRRRREQVSSSMPGGVPDRLTDHEMDTLASVRRIAIEYDTRDRRANSATIIDGEDEDVAQLLAAVERRHDRAHAMSSGACADWKVVVHVFGYPSVRNPQGVAAEFRKKRSLELLTWLVLNRDRQRRSAARTALWDVDITDSTFSTVISDMRRALGELGNPDHSGDWCPPSYSDEVYLSPSVVSDADLLAHSLREFVDGRAGVESVMRNLSWIRDVPFAGTTYSWADLDGTTTRLVILAVDAATTVARWARDHRRPDLLVEAVSAGLRVMPGCEELLGIQEQLISSTARRVVSRTRP